MFEIWVQTLSDVDHVFFHLIHVGGCDEVTRFFSELVVEEGNVFEEVVAGGMDDLPALVASDELGEDPRETDGSTADHEAGSIGLLVVGAARFYVDNIPVGDDGAGHGFHGVFDEIGVDGGAVLLAHGTAVNGECIDAVFFKNAEDVIKFLMRFEADAGFYREPPLNGVP